MSAESEGLLSFLEAIWGTEDRTVFIAYKDNPTAFDVPPAKQWPQDKEKIVQYFLAASARGKDVYFSPAVYKDGSTSKHKTNVRGSRVLWVDFDGNAEEAYARVEAGEAPSPTYRVATGREGHEHWYWELDKEYPTEEFEQINKRIAYFFGADHCWNADRVLRPPFTKNFKDPKDPGSVDIAYEYEEMNPLSYFASRLPTVSVKDVADQLLELGELPTIADVLADYKWDAQHKDLFLNPPDRVRGTHTRNRSMMRLAYYMAEKGMPSEAMWTMLDDLDTRLGKFVGRSDRNRRLSELIIKAQGKYPYGESQAIQTEEDIQVVYSINELLNADFHMEWLIEDLLAHRSVNIVEALPGTGKSRLTMQWAEAIAGGGKFLNWQIGRPMKTMYISLEMDKYMTKHFAEGLSNGSNYEDDLSANFLVVPVGSPVPIGSSQGMEFFEYLLGTHKPEVVFVDALGTLTDDELSEQVSKLINKQLNALIAKFDVCFILVHHLRKDEKNKTSPPKRSDTYGSQYVAANAALIFALWAPDEQDSSHIELITLKSRAALSKQSKIILDGTVGFKFVIKEEAEDDNDSDVAPKSSQRRMRLAFPE